tara:strand:+ start:60037 stop:61518 length:1482 start_codon:yes stop_codon:yes gene_type:complete
LPITNLKITLLKKGTDMCGVIGIHGSPESAQEAYQGLLLMQHRGQDAAGILTQTNNQINLHKDVGLVDKVFSRDNLIALKGETSIGHTRYSTIGKIEAKDCLPFFSNYPFGISLAHNGNLKNIDELKLKLHKKYQRFTYSNNDAEVMLNIISHYLSQKEHFNFELLSGAISELMEMCDGAYAVVGGILSHGLFAFRDPHGIRPLVYGKKFNGTNWVYAFASESNTLEYLDYQYIKDVRPGELIYIDNQMNFYSKNIQEKQLKTCMFEWIYFANPESVIDKKMVYQNRIHLGDYLAKKIKDLIDLDEVDVVVPVPETSRISAIRLSELIQKPYRELLIKNRYIQRSFILNDQKSRENAVRLKLSPVKKEIEGKNIILVDDSIVRGTTSKNIIKLMRNAGAKKIIFASTCPPILFPCHYGIDFPTTKELVAHGKNYQEIKDALGADEVIYLNIPMLIDALETENICKKCLDGKEEIEFNTSNLINKQDPKNEINL